MTRQRPPVGDLPDASGSGHRRDSQDCTVQKGSCGRGPAGGVRNASRAGRRPRPEGIIGDVKAHPKSSLPFDQDVRHDDEGGREQDHVDDDRLVVAAHRFTDSRPRPLRCEEVSVSIAPPSRVPRSTPSQVPTGVRAVRRSCGVQPWARAGNLSYGASRFPPRGADQPFAGAGGQLPCGCVLGAVLGVIQHVDVGDLAFAPGHQGVDSAVTPAAGSYHPRHRRRQGQREAYVADRTGQQAEDLAAVLGGRPAVADGPVRRFAGVQRGSGPPRHRRRRVRS